MAMGAVDPGQVLLSGIVGSTAYGLAGPSSDIDRLGIFAVPTGQLHGLHQPAESHVTHDPDSTLHEAAKWCRLALGGNPTVTELAWLPEDLYEVRTELGEQLIAIRRAFLSAQRVRDAYLGYATQQFRKLEARGDGSFSADTRKRTAKHARHLARLIHQGRQLYATGTVEIRLANPRWFLDFGQRVANGDLPAARTLMAEAEDAFDHIRSPLPDRPDEQAAERWLRTVRATFYRGRSMNTPDGFAAADTATLVAIRCNLLAGLGRVADTLNDGTFHTVGDHGTAPPAQSGQLTLILLAGVTEELERRREADRDPGRRGRHRGATEGSRPVRRDARAS